MESDQNYLGEEKLELTNQAIAFLEEIRKWTMFLSILGFVGIGFLVLGGLFMGTFMSTMSNAFGDQIPGGLPMGGGFIAFIYLLLALLYFFPVFYLYKFSNYTKKALDSRDTEMLTNAFSNLKSHYKFLGIVAIIIIGLYLLMFVFILLGGAFAAFM
jgi:hypothetical protein